MKRVGFWGAVIVLSGLSSLILSGPLFKFEPRESAAVIAAVHDARDIDQYLAEKESKVERLRADLAKAVVWANADKRRTPYSIIYIHGFPASRGETAPLFEDIAKELGANLFYTRLKGHGLDDGGEAFATIGAQDWYDDAREALAIGRRIGERVIVVGMSTGAALTLPLIAENRNASDIAAHIMISPNYCPVDDRARFISGPFGPSLARVLIGKYREFETENAAHRYYWTPRQRAEGVATMMDVVNAANRLDLRGLRVPTLTLYSKRDTVVSVPLIESKHASIGASVKKIVDLPEANGHLIAGSAVAPQGLAAAKREILSFLKEAL